MVKTALIVIAAVALVVILKGNVLGTQTAACVGLRASVPGTFTASSDKSGEVTLKWNLSTNIDRYDLLYGLNSGKIAKDYQYGAAKIGDAASSSYTVKGLSSGKTYYFRLATYCGGDRRPASLSNEVSARAK